MADRARGWWRRVSAFMRSAQRDRDLADELAAHLELHVDDNLRLGMTPEEARRQAVLKLGGIEPVKERVRDRRGLPRLEALWRDLKCAIRFLRRSPGFTAVAILSLALGIGANSAIFSLVDSLLLRSLPVDRPNQLVEIVAPTARGARKYLDLSRLGSESRSAGSVRGRTRLEPPPGEPSAEWRDADG